MVAKLSDRVEGSTLANPDDFVKKAGDTMTGGLTATSLEVNSISQFSTLTLKTAEDTIRNCLAYWESTSNATDDTYNILSREVNGNGNSRKMFRAEAFGSTALYFDGTPKFTTLNTGVEVVGNLSADGVSVSDNETINLGNSDDLSILHNGTNGFIRNDTGLLILESNDGEFRVTTGASNKKAIRCFPDASVQLFNNDSVKLATTSAGGTLTGTWSGGGLSDERLKENIQTRNGLDNILSLTGVDWDWKEDIDFDVEGTETSGFTAQNWAEVYPEQVSEVYPELPKPEPELDEDGQPIEDAEPVEPEEIDNTGRTDGKFQINRNLNSQKFDADVVEAIKSLHSTIEALTARLDALEG